ncbi:MAG: hypothetical protein C0619_12095 [Desulfuromonas sp.]|jgi:hypothetical protein|nr:MAG: hypothetical protein C0619_12095 [Desulfuromonas sp.]
MSKMTATLIVCFLLIPVLTFAHHPAADIVDEEIYALINEMVSDTPHADLEFIDMGNVDITIITTDTVSAAEDLIDEGLLADISLLDGDVTVSVEFIPESAIDSIKLTLSANEKDNEKGKEKKMKWSEWGGPVKITVVQDCTSCLD